MKALVTDAGLRSVLAGIRGLGRAGHRVIALAPDRGAAGLWSRYTQARVVEEGTHHATLAKRLSLLAEHHGPCVVYPGREIAIDTLLSGPLPPGVHLPYKDPGALATLRDKRRLVEVAADAGLTAPKTLAEATAAELRRWRPSGPCVVKPAHPNGALPSALVADSADELHALLVSLPPDEPLLVQERATGPLLALALVLDPEGRAVARFQQVARRTWPPGAGISTIAESVTLDESLASRATDMLGAAGFTGLAQLQFVEVEQGPALIDVNPRFYGSLPLALACGVNLPAAWHASVTGEGTVTTAGYRAGVSFHWLEGEMLVAAKTSASPLTATARALLRPPSRPRAPAVWASDDPVSSAAFGAGLVVDIARKRLGA